MSVLPTRSKAIHEPDLGRHLRPGAGVDARRVWSSASGDDNDCSGGNRAKKP